MSNDKILSEASYDRIKALNQGCYVWLTPSSESVLQLRTLLHGAPFASVSSKDFHLTVLVSRTAPVLKQLPLERLITGTVASLEMWVDNKKSAILVAPFINTSDIVSLHSDFIGLGMLHGYSNYLPHITLSRAFVVTQKSIDWFDAINNQLRDAPLQIVFDKAPQGTSNITTHP